MLSLAHGVLCLRYTEKSLRAKVATCSGNCNYNAPPGTLLRADQLSATLSRRHGVPRIAINGSVCSGTVRDVSVWRFHQNVGGGIFAVPREDSPAHHPKNDSRQPVHAHRPLLPREGTPFAAYGQRACPFVATPIIAIAAFAPDCRGGVFAVPRKDSPAHRPKCVAIQIAALPEM